MGDKESDMPEFDWITLHNEMEGHHLETTKEKMIRKIKENPFVPLGKSARKRRKT